MKKILIVSLSLLFAGCSLIDEIPSFYDDNESKAVIDVWVDVKRLDCDGNFLHTEINRLEKSTQWLMTYSQSKGSKDVLEVVTLFNSTVEGIAEKDVVSPTFCKMKKKSMLKQIENISNAIMRRF